MDEGCEDQQQRIPIGWGYHTDMGQRPLSALKGPGRALWLRHPSVTLEVSQGHEDLGIITSVHQRRRSSRAPTKANTRTVSWDRQQPPPGTAACSELTLTGCHAP